MPNRTRDLPEGNRTRDIPETNSYGFYSKVLNKPFDTLEELKEAEKVFNLAHEAEIKAKEEKKADAKKVEDAYKTYLDVCEKASAEVRKAREAYLKARAEFIEKHNSYHMTYTNVNGDKAITFSDLVDEAFKTFFNF